MKPIDFPKEEEDLLPPIQNLYSCQESLLQKYDRLAHQSRFLGSSPNEYFLWQKKERQKLWDLLGLEKMDSSPLSPQRREITPLPGGITRESWLIQTEPGVWISFFLMIPSEKKGAIPFLCPAGHGGAGKYSVAGAREYPAIRASIQKYHYDYGLFLAKAGFVALCPDPRGFGERREKLTSPLSLPEALGGDCMLLAHMGNPLGIPVAGMFTWDLMRSIDYLTWRGEWDLDQMGCLGFSGGGMQTLFLAALDERVQRAVISGYFYGYKEALLRQSENCCCNYVPHLWEAFDMGDIACLIAPRPLLIQSCRQDLQNGSRGIDNVTEQVEILRRVYSLLGAKGKLLYEICPGPHQFHEENLLENLALLSRR